MDARTEARHLAQKWWLPGEAARACEAIDALCDHATRWHPLCVFVSEAVVVPFAEAVARAPPDAIIGYLEQPTEKMREALQWCAATDDVLRRTTRFLALTWGMPCHWIVDSPMRAEAAACKTPWARALRAVLLRLDQAKDILWWFVRRFWIGASNIGSVLRMQDEWQTYDTPFEEWRTPLDVWRDNVGLGERVAFGPVTMRAVVHGKVMEGLPRDVLAHFLDMVIMEIGTRIHPRCDAYTQSPDGLLRTREDATEWLWPAKDAECERDPYDPAIHAYDDMVLSQCVAVAEFKCQWIKAGPYQDWPDGYVPQIVQGMIVHHAPCCYTVSIYYVPERTEQPYETQMLPPHSEDTCRVVIQRIDYEVTAATWLEARLAEYATFVKRGCAAVDLDARLAIEPEIELWHLEQIIGTGRERVAPDSPTRRKLMMAVPRWRGALRNPATRYAAGRLGHVGPYRHVLDVLPRVTLMNYAHVPAYLGDVLPSPEIVSQWQRAFATIQPAEDAKLRFEKELQRRTPTCSPHATREMSDEPDTDVMSL